MHESAFLAALRSAPADRLARLAYADWLEEHGDPRAELIRVEEEMRVLPVFTDRFWEFEPRRNELRATSPPDWLAELGYGTIVEPVFRHGVPDGWRERWRLIREFTERWHRIPMPDVGGRRDEIREAEARLGRTLPPSVREYVAFAFDIRRTEENAMITRDVYQMENLDRFDAVSLLLQGEGDYHWAVWHRDLQLDDPPVNGFQLDYENEEEQRFVPDDRNPLAPSVTSFALNYAMDYLHGAAAGGGFGTEVRDNAPIIRELEATCPVQAAFERHRIFEGDDIHVQLTPLHGQWGYSLTIEVSKPIPREAIPEFLWDLRRGGGWSHGMFTPPAPDTR